MSRALLIHPWIHDFAAHDFWLRPLGLLRLAAHLRSKGVDLDFVDCLDMNHPSMADRAVHRGPYGQGKLYKEEIPKPSALSWFPRKYSRYGMPPHVFDALLGELATPDIILMSSGMTYWYPGLQETISHCRRAFGDVPIVIGGIYPTLCYEHAQDHSGADLVVSGGNWDEIIQTLARYLPITLGEGATEIPPAWELLPHTQSIAVKTSEGCPFRCTYCASGILSPGFNERVSEDVVNEIFYALRNTQAVDVAFYDDALLWGAENRLMVILDEVDKSAVSPRFHCPNGLHARFMTPLIARKMRETRFMTVRLGLESANLAFHERTGMKVQPEDYCEAVGALLSTGYSSAQIGTYVMVGLPGQSLREVEESIRFVFSLGATPYLAEYSPIPGTHLWGEAVRTSPFPLEEEPLFHNNTLLPCRGKDLSFEDFLKLKASLQHHRNRTDLQS